MTALLHPSDTWHAPYESRAANEIYNLVFCEPRDRFRAGRGKEAEQAAGWQQVLFAEPPDVAALEKLAADTAQEGRIRYLAYARLRELGAPVTPKLPVGVVAEVGLIGGVDTLAAYSDGGVRYINHSGKIVVVEGVEDFRPLVRRLFAAALPVVAAIGPWEHPRRPPPPEGTLRLTFLVSDGLYFGEGPAEALQVDAMAGPVFQAATRLLVKVIERGKSAG
jgi:hypothetical protein